MPSELSASSKQDTQFQWTDQYIVLEWTKMNWFELNRRLSSVQFNSVAPKAVQRTELEWTELTNISQIIKHDPLNFTENIIRAACGGLFTGFSIDIGSILAKLAPCRNTDDEHPLTDRVHWTNVNWIELPVHREQINWTGPPVQFSKVGPKPGSSEAVNATEHHRWSQIKAGKRLEAANLPVQVTKFNDHPHELSILAKGTDTGNTFYLNPHLWPGRR